MTKEERAARGAFPARGFMDEALSLAARGLESVSPNPMVGALVVRRGRVVGRGWHRRFGGPHAEVEALRDAGDAARGADLYVTLEPCSHHGKTPPCAEAIVRAGIRRVVCALVDPNPVVRGRGLRLLRRAGIEVVVGVERKAATDLNLPFIHFHRTGRPWVVAKWAMSLDGKIATSAGESRWITGREARARGHALRRRVDAIVVGTGTLVADDPRLDPRPARGRRPWRVILDRTGRVPLEARLLAAGLPGGPRVYAASPRVPADRLREIAGRGIETIVLPEKPDGLDLEYLLAELAARGVAQLLVEGGGELTGTLLARGLVDEVAAFVAPILVGGRDAPGPVEGPGCPVLADAPRITGVVREDLGPDILLTGRVARR